MLASLRCRSNAPSGLPTNIPTKQQRIAKAPTATATQFMGQPAHAPTQTDMGELMKAVEGSRHWERERRGHGPSHKRSRGALAAPASLVLGFLSQLATASHDNATGHRLSSLLYLRSELGRLEEADAVLKRERDASLVRGDDVAHEDADHAKHSEAAVLELDGELLRAVLVGHARVAAKLRSARAVEVEGARGALGLHGEHAKLEEASEPEDLGPAHARDRANSGDTVRNVRELKVRRVADVAREVADTLLPDEANEGHHAHAAVLDLNGAPPVELLLVDALGEAERVEEADRAKNAELAARVEHRHRALGRGASDRGAADRAGLGHEGRSRGGEESEDGGLEHGGSLE
eukprot:CAMPEP_0182525274 /NCGR_PEP_ID=MMETSP1323-20130603/2364_1 /TAXON_ID=236787 /ORGANISM="Florenciella parvula, Strain RCC1693" /LENGTH=348 /DNA_ID=CAMNT_0024733975 /DNA_START=112 /DNA_END=1154 /DNA_ORIENTATION=+